MSINAINSISLYEYYYTINEKKEKKSSPLEKEMKKYGLVATDNEQVNIALLQRAKEAEKLKQKEKKEDTDYSQRPWADIMYQLNISFNENPSDDIVDIKEKLDFLLQGIKDETLEGEIKDLEDYVEKLYLDYDRISSGFIKTTVLTSQLNNFSMINKATIF